VLQRGEQARLAFEAREPVGVVRERGRQQLHRDLAVQPRVERAVDLAHASSPERAEHLVCAQAGSRGQVHSGKILRLHPAHIESGKPPQSARASKGTRAVGASVTL
jgi:hypothetical protein